MSKPDKHLLARAAAGCAIGVGIGFGTCGVGLAFDKYSFASTMSGVGLFVFVSCFLGLVLIALIALVQAIMGVFRR